MIGANNMLESGINTSQIISFLQENGYPVFQGNNHISFPAFWRGGIKTTSVTGYPEQNLFIDWVEGDRFNYKGLVKRVLNLQDDIEINNILEKSNSNSNLNTSNNLTLKQEVKMNEIFNEEILKDFEPNYSYWQDRGISLSVSQIFEGGKCKNEMFKDRQCLLIRNSKNQLIGITGRDLTGKKKAKWKHKGTKGSWVWPASINGKIIQKKNEVILVESPADVLSLFECGIDNVLCLFGVELSLGVLNYLLRLNLKKIIISTNNEINLNGGVGNEAALKIKKKLDKYFDSKTSVICLPNGKDFNEILTNKGKEDILNWYKNIK